MKINILKKFGICAVAAAMTAGLAACNTVIKVEYDYNPKDYVTLGEYKGIGGSVDTD